MLESSCVARGTATFSVSLDIRGGHPAENSTELRNKGDSTPHPRACSRGLVSIVENRLKHKIKGDRLLSDQRLCGVCDLTTYRLSNSPEASLLLNHSSHAPRAVDQQVAFVAIAARRTTFAFVRLWVSKSKCQTLHSPD